MTITTASPFVAPPRISKPQFVRVLERVDSPWADQASEIYDLIAGEGHDPAVWLAIAGKEHTYGTNRDSVLWRNDTRSWTNARTVRHPGISGWEVIRDPVRGSNYVKYASVIDSIRDGMYRITDPTHRYVREGRTTIGQVFAIWTEGDGPEYAAFVVNAINGWITEDEEGPPTMTGDLPGVPFIPADRRHHTPGRRDPWPTVIIGHHTDGHDSLAWLTTSPNSDVSATYLLWHDGSIRAQLVRHADTPHTTGYMNDDSLSFEWERFWATQQGISDGQYHRIGQSVALIYLAERKRGNPHFAGPMLRTHLADHNDFYGTTCPGNLDMGRVHLIAAAIVAGESPEGPAPPRAITFAEVPYTISGGFKGQWELLGQTRHHGTDIGLNWLQLGLPRSPEFEVQLDGQRRVAQVFDCGALVWQPDQPRPWDVRAPLSRHWVEIIRQGVAAGVLDLAPLGLALTSAGNITTLEAA